MAAGPAIRLAAPCSDPIGRRLRRNSHDRRSEWPPGSRSDWPPAARSGWLPPPRSVNPPAHTLRTGIDEATHDLAWKHVKKQSERQFGAFLILYLTNFKKPFLVGKEMGAYDERANFRNSVIHGGCFPSAKETKEYARHVFELIRDTKQSLKNLDADAVQKIQLRHYFRGHRAVEKKAGPPKPDKDGLYRGAGGSAMPMMLSPMIQDAPMDFDARLAASVKNISWWGFPKELVRT